MVIGLDLLQNLKGKHQSFFSFLERLVLSFPWKTFSLIISVLH